jgi:hypothetical protein
MRHPHELVFAEIKAVPIRKLNEKDETYLFRLRAYLLDNKIIAPPTDKKITAQNIMRELAAELVMAAEQLSDITPEGEKHRATDVDSGAARQATNAYQKSYMVEYRKRKAAELKALKAGA